ncbi:hypothetical protein [Novosphingobium sp.]|uniref:hypothetical protein n=1 Tax=Novosphingobium sp. TaxID=1874826 RepID=UPI002608E471|nr:hypothetical protein [Novosphingobium sp.]
MRNAHLRWGLAAAILMVASPATAGPRAQQIISKLKAVFGKSAPQPAARNAVNAAKPVLQRGKATLEAQRANYNELGARAQGLKEQRSDLRRAAREARAALMNDRSNPALRAAFDQAMAAYAPVREAHVSARDARDAARKRYQLTQSQMGLAMNAATSSVGARAARPPSPGAPRIRRQAFVAVEPGFASAAKSSKEIYGPLPYLPQQSSNGNSAPARTASQFNIRSQESPYAKLTLAESSSQRLSGTGSSGGSSLILPSVTGGVQQSDSTSSSSRLIRPQPQVTSFARVSYRISQSYSDLGL